MKIEINFCHSYISVHSRGKYLKIRKDKVAELEADILDDEYLFDDKILSAREIGEGNTKKLPLSPYYTCVQALRSLIHDYYLLLALLESELNAGNLTLHKMLFYVRPTLNTVDVLADALSDILENELRDGQALTQLFNKTSGLEGDEDSQKFVLQLCSK
ncbi:gamma-tubulin complex component 2 homolog [Eurosta solidaginis]|uniref:gamma-tubulin complex component 2 homolog n=1 Tax=Eurosta solidaginis TaxID=178769 RepID=UPI0035308DB3